MSIFTAPSHVFAETAPKRVVSMNLCTDQLAMMIAKPGQLYSVSNLSLQEEGSVLAEQAKNYKINAGFAEEVFIMKPDLILAGIYTTTSSVNLLRRLGFRVEVFPLAHSFEDIRKNINKMGKLLGQQEKAAKVLAEFDNSLQEIASDSSRSNPLAALYYANSYTSGRNTLANDVLAAARFDNLSQKLGLQGFTKLPLELLVLNQPDLIITSQRWSEAPALAQHSLTHPALLHLQERSGFSPIADKYWICGTPFITQAVKSLLKIRKHIQTQHSTDN